MRRLFDPLLFFLFTGSAEDLAKQVQFLKVENEILRSKLPTKIPVTDAERRRLLRYGRLVGAALKSLISIVSYRTFQRWVKDADGVVGRVKRKLGRRPTPVDVQQLILQIASDTGWGYTRILGELKKLGIRVSKSTVKKILKAHGFDTGPERRPGRRGRKRALIAVAHTQLVIVYHLLKEQTVYQELGGDYLERLDAERATEKLVHRLEQLGH